MNSRSLKLENTKALIQMYEDNKLSFSDCMKKIAIIGDIHLLDKDQMGNGKLKICKNIE